MAVVRRYDLFHLFLVLFLASVVVAGTSLPWARAVC
jgi:hypothetical protein